MNLQIVLLFLLCMVWALHIDEQKLMMHDNYRKRFRTSYIVHEVRSVRERERERERDTERDRRK